MSKVEKSLRAKKGEPPLIHKSISKARLEDCLALTSKLFLRDDIYKIEPQSGGLFNYLLRIETRRGNYFFKQFLDDTKNPIFNVPNIAATKRSNLAYEVQRLAAAVNGLNTVPEILIFDRQRNAFLMAEASGKTALIEYLRVGVIPETLINHLPHLLGTLHQSTYGRYGCHSIFANTEFRDFKLKIQYDDIAKLLSPNESKFILEFKKSYQIKTLCVTHGDINSRNILIDENALGIIDFEQSHLGSPAYDLAYILSEIFISRINKGWNDESMSLISSFLSHYFQSFYAVNRDLVENEMIKHLAIQVIYRFWGPSHKSWTFYLDEANRNLIIRKARDILMDADTVDQVFDILAD